MNLELTIERLILHDMPDSDRYQIAAAIEAALTRLLSERGVPPGLAQQRHAAYVEGGSLRLAPGSTVETLGVEVAQAIYDGLARGGAASSAHAVSEV
jgi:hypothetical protein